MSPFRLRAARPPVAPLRVRAAAFSRPGNHLVNEDATGHAESGGLALHVLADGLGGHRGGEVGARLAVEHCLTHFRARPSLEPDALAAMVRDAGEALRAAAERWADAGAVRSTLVVLALDGFAAHWAHVGDSRLYHFRGDRVRSRTRDHSVPEMLHRAGDIDEAAIHDHPDRNRLLQALGQQAPPRVAVSGVAPLEPGDAFLLCSDGWWEHLPESEMEAALRGSPDPAAWLGRMRARLEVGVHGPPRDDYTAIAVMTA